MVAKSDKKKSADYPSYNVMVVTAIKELKNRKGSTKQAILKYMISTYKLQKQPNVHTKLALLRLIKNGNVELTKFGGTGLSGRFKLKASIVTKKKQSKSKKTKKSPKKPAKNVINKTVKKSASSPARKKKAAKKSPKSPAKKAAKKAKSPKKSKRSPQKKQTAKKSIMKTQQKTTKKTARKRSPQKKKGKK